VDNATETANLAKKIAELEKETFKTSIEILAGEYGDKNAPFLTEEFEKEKENSKSKWQKLAEGIWDTSNYTKGGTNELSQILDKYQKVTGKTYTFADNEIQDKNGIDTIYIEDPETGQDKVLASMDAIIATIEAAEAKEKVADENVEVTNMLNEITTKYGKEISDLFSQFATN
jgi:hypothetical protein